MSKAHTTWLAGILYKYDPIGIAPEAPKDEYEGEAIEIMERAIECNDWTMESILAIVHETFSRFFTSKIAGPIDRECYTQIAQKYLKALKAAAVWIDETNEKFFVRYHYPRNTEDPPTAAEFDKPNYTLLQVEQWADESGCILRE